LTAYKKNQKKQQLERLTPMALLGEEYELESIQGNSELKGFVRTVNAEKH
jgi:hypothetical protein